MYVDAGGDITGLKRHGGWKSTTVAEGYIDNSMVNKMNTANKILQSVNDNSSSTSNFFNKINNEIPFIAPDGCSTSTSSFNYRSNSHPLQ